MGNISNIN
jgi:hypothetical protein